MLINPTMSERFKKKRIKQKIEIRIIHFQQTLLTFTKFVVEERMDRYKWQKKILYIYYIYLYAEVLLIIQKMTNYTKFEFELSAEAVNFVNIVTIVTAYCKDQTEQLCGTLGLLQLEQQSHTSQGRGETILGAEL